MTHRARLTIAAVLLLVVGVVVAGVCVRHDVARDDGVPAVLKLDDGGLRFTYHVMTGDEGLFDVGSDPKMLKNLARDRPADAKRLRDELTKRVKAKHPEIDELSDLRRRPEVMERLRGHPYF